MRRMEKQCRTCIHAETIHAETFGDGWLECLHVNDEGALFRSIRDGELAVMIVWPTHSCASWQGGSARVSSKSENPDV
jgi:hypothetical protein